MDIFAWFRRKPTPQPKIPGHTPEQLEAFIDYAGREQVFARARELGWGKDADPPMWVWENIAAQIVASRGGPGVTIN